MFPISVEMVMYLLALYQLLMQHEALICLLNVNEQLQNKNWILYLQFLKNIP